MNYATPLLLEETGITVVNCLSSSTKFLVRVPDMKAEITTRSPWERHQDEAREPNRTQLRSSCLKRSTVSNEVPPLREWDYCLCGLWLIPPVGSLSLAWHPLNLPSTEKQVGSFGVYEIENQCVFLIYCLVTFGSSCIEKIIISNLAF